MSGSFGDVESVYSLGNGRTARQSVSIGSNVLEGYCNPQHTQIWARLRSGSGAYGKTMDPKSMWCCADCSGHQKQQHLTAWKRSSGGVKRTMGTRHEPQTFRTLDPRLSCGSGRNPTMFELWSRDSWSRRSLERQIDEFHVDPVRPWTGVQ